MFIIDDSSNVKESWQQPTFFHPPRWMVTCDEWFADNVGF
jgi:hypothetical protein